MLDSVNEKIAQLQRSARPLAIGRRLDRVPRAVRDVERRIQRAEEQSDHELPVMAQPAGIPASYEEHVQLMFDLQVLAYQCDLTRVITFMLARELSGRTYPANRRARRASSDCRTTSDEPEKIAKMAKINTYHVQLFAYYLDKLQATPDGDGSLLDHMMLIYGAGHADSNRHDPGNLPIAVAGRRRRRQGRPPREVPRRTRRWRTSSSRCWIDSARRSTISATATEGSISTACLCKPARV